MTRTLKIATCQFPVGRDIEKNLSYMLPLMQQAAERNVDIVHFSESSLSGYAGVDFLDYATQDETLLQDSLQQVAKQARQSSVWVIVGGHHFVEEHTKPTNCLWLFDNSGNLLQRYDKRICAGAHGTLEHLLIRHLFYCYKFN